MVWAQLQWAGARCEERLATLLNEQAVTDVDAAITLLELRFSRGLGRREAIAISGSDGGPMRVDPDPLGTLAQLLASVAIRQSGVAA
jgi:hypothetical protein